MRERVMVIGKGGREHALAHRLSRGSSGKHLREVVMVPGNDGASFTVPCFKPDTDDNNGILTLANYTKPDLIVIGPEEPLALGLTDALTKNGYKVFGPTKKAAQIESSKSFMKDLAVAANIPTASFKQFSQEEEALAFIEKARFPAVIKADGLCAGKGVVVAADIKDARDAIRKHIPTGRILIEEFLQGVEISVIALCNESDALLFAPVQDHKRLLNGDKGPNTGGMGVVGPTLLPQIDSFMSAVKETFFLPALRQMKRMGCPFQGALFAGLMVNGDDVRLLEFNARFGDPETQALAFGLKVDLFPILLDIANGANISHYTEDILMKMLPTSAITMASKGYPEAPEKGDSIKITSQPNENGMIFYSGVARGADGGLITHGGRVLTCVAREETLEMAIKKSYDIVAGISFRGSQYRTDIGHTFL